MADRIDRYVDGQEAAVNRKIEKIYRGAAAMARKLTDAFFRPYRKESERMRKQVEAGEITKADYQTWLQTHVFAGPDWERTASEITKAYVDADTEARETVGYTDRQTFAEVMNMAADQIEERAPRAFQSRISFDIVDQKTVDRLVRDNPQLLPEWKINEPKDYMWNYRRVQNTVTQGIVSGKSVHEIGKDLTGTLTAQNGRKMEMFARTALTGAHNAGRVERMKETEAMGVRVLKKWMAVHDARTRDAHADLDGKTAKPDESFESALGPIQYPGDPTADPANVYNCRCTLTYVYPDFD